MSTPETHFERAMAHFKVGAFKEAAAILEEAVSIEPRNADVLEALGVMYEKLGRVGDAIAAFKKLSKVDPDNIMAHANLSQIYVAQGKIQEAEAEQAEARRLSWKIQLKDRTSAQPKFSAEEQIERFKKVIALDPGDVLGYFSLGGAYATALRWKEAEEAYQKAIEVDADHSASYYGLGQALQEQGKVKEAVQIFEQGIPIAEKKGDLIPFKKMSARLREIRGN